MAAALAEHDGVLALGGGAVLAPADPRAARRPPARSAPWCCSTSGLHAAARRVGLDPGPAAARRATRARSCGRCSRPGRRSTSGSPPSRSPPTSRDARRRGRRGRWPAARPERRRETASGSTVARRPRPTTCVVGPACSGELPGLCWPAPPQAARRPRRRRWPPRPVPRVGTLRPAGVGTPSRRVPDGEAAKTLEVAAGCWDAFGRLGLTRSDAVVGVGGGAATDLAGFVAATWLRGVRVRAGADDAARHGRRGGGRQDRHQHRRGQEPGRRLPPAGRRAVRPRHAGDAAATPTPRRAWPRWSSAASSPTRDPGPDRGRPAPADAGDTAELIERAVRVKADVVGGDLREAGPREILNYGHTLAPRDRAGRGLQLAARRGGRRRHGLRRRAGRPRPGC